MLIHNNACEGEREPGNMLDYVFRSFSSFA